MIRSLFFIISLFLSLQVVKAGDSACAVLYLDSAGQIVSEAPLAPGELSPDVFTAGKERPNPLFELVRKKQKLNKKITAAVLAFPFPFGIVGLHRIYMGTKPYVPVVYIATIGGVFGILPFIDFCVLMFDKDFNRYENNGKVFMWIKH